MEMEITVPDEVPVMTLPNVTFTLNTTKSMTRDEAVRALETLLALDGIAIAPFDEKFLKVTPMAQAKAEAPEMIEGSTLKMAPSGRLGSSSQMSPAHA